MNQKWFLAQWASLTEHSYVFSGSYSNDLAEIWQQHGISQVYFTLAASVAAERQWQFGGGSGLLSKIQD